MNKKDKSRVFGPDSKAAGNSPLTILAALKGSLPQGEDPAPVPPPRTPPQTAKIVVSRERKGRGGKTVTAIRGLELNDAALAQLAREMRHSLGTGGGVEDAAIILNGDQTLRAAEILMQRGYKRIVIP